MIEANKKHKKPYQNFHIFSQFKIKAGGLKLSNILHSRSAGNQQCFQHGSRFTKEGELINGPAVTNLKQIHVEAEQLH